MKFYLSFLVLALLSELAFSDSNIYGLIQPISNSDCQKALDDNLEVVSLDNANEKLVCLFIFSRNLTEALINFDSKLITVYRKSFNEIPFLKKSRNGTREIYIYQNKEKGVSININLKVFNSNCGGDEGSCCGEDLKGKITFLTSEKSAVYPVSFYRGN